MNKRSALIELRSVLADIYDDEASIRRIMRDAAIDSKYVSMDTISINFWDSILDQAQKKGRMDNLIEVVLQEYNENERLRTAIAAYREQREAGARVERTYFDELPYSPTPLVPQPDWRGGMEIEIHGHHYVIYDPVRQEPAPDASCIRQLVKARQSATGRMVLIKGLSIKRETPLVTEAQKILEKEQRLLAEFEQYPNFPRLLELPNATDPLILVQSLADGKTLREKLGEANQPLDLILVLRLLRGMNSLCRMLQVLHHNKCTHRNLTPETVLVTKQHNAILRDLGLAAYPVHSRESTHAYAAPEQTQRTLVLPGPYTDVYQLGTLIYHYVAGRLPNPALGSVPPPSTWQRDIPSLLDEVLLKALAQQPDQRWATIADFADGLRRATVELQKQIRGAA